MTELFDFIRVFDFIGFLWTKKWWQGHYQTNRCSLYGCEDSVFQFLNMPLNTLKIPLVMFYNTNEIRYYRRMITSFHCPDTEALFHGQRVAWFVNIAASAMRKLAMLSRAATLEDLRIPPGNRLEKLLGDRAGQYSIRINDQWRICFCFEDGNAYDVEIVDYH